MHAMLYADEIAYGMTQRTRHQVNYPETYQLIFERVRSELNAAAGSSQPIKHLILLLGIPIAYPV